MTSIRLLLAVWLTVPVAVPATDVPVAVPATDAVVRVSRAAGAVVPVSGAAGPAVPAGQLPGRRPVRAPARRDGYRWPLDGPPPVVRRFAPPPQPWLPGHRGVDLGAVPGAVVRAAGTGTVAFAGTVAGRGVVSVDHAGGLRTTYEPLTPSVTAGQPVRAGDPVGILVAGHEGCPAAACLHWGLRRGDVYLDPLALLGAGRVRLLPLEQRR